MISQLLVGETFVDCGVHKLQKTCPVAAAVQNVDRLAVQSEVSPSQDFKELVQRARTAGKNHNCVRVRKHGILPLMHGLCHNQGIEIGVRDFNVQQMFRNDTEYCSAGGFGGSGGDAH